MSKYLVFLSALLCLIEVSGQNHIKSYEYWFDDAVSEKITVNTAPVAELHLENLLLSSTLTNGLHKVQVRFKDANDLYSSPVAGYFLKVNAGQSGIVSYEYCWNDDWAGATQVTLSNSPVFELSSLINTEDIPQGFHRFLLRFKDATGKWSTPFTQMVYKNADEGLQNSQIVGYEYWFGSNTSESQYVEVNSTEVLFLDDLFATSLPDGVHEFRIRFKDGGGRWSVVTSKAFIKGELNPGDIGIIGYEYWFDDNISSAQYVDQAVSNVLFLDELFNVNLPVGLHRFYIRFKDVTNKWSVALNTLFIKKENYPEDTDITGYQYWFDNNISAAIYVESSNADVLFLDDALLAPLPNGLHKFNIRFKDNTGKWSSSVNQLFLKSQEGQIPPNGVTAYRYWFNSSATNATTVELGYSANPYLLFTEINALPLDTGNHVLHIQLRDEKNIWSAPLSQAFYNIGQPSLVSITPNQGGNIGDVTVNILGQGFFEGTTVRLVRAGEDDITVPDSLFAVVNNKRNIIASFDLRDRTIGFWDVVVDVPLADTTMVLTNGFEILEGIKPVPLIDIIGPSNIRPNRWENYTLVVTNNGNIDLTGVPVFLAITDSMVNMEFTTPILRYNDSLEVIESFNTLIDFIPIDTLYGQPFDGVVYAMILARIPPGQSKSITLRLKSSNNYQLRAWTTEPLYGSPFKEPWVNCAIQVLEEVLGFIPITSVVSGELVDAFVCFYDKVTRLLDPVLNYSSGSYQSELGVSGSVGFVTDFFFGFLESTINCAESFNALSGRDFFKRMLKRVDLANSVIEAVDNISDECGDFWYEINSDLKPVNTVTSFDPNDKYGPNGSGEERFMSNPVIPYVIRFENDSSATAPAQWVQIVDTLDTGIFDFSTFQLGFVSFGNRMIDVPNGLQSWSEYVDLRPAQDMVVLVEADFNMGTGIVTWTFTALDPMTYEPVTDALDGFLPPNINSPEGEGGVFFTIRLLEGLEFGTEISNKAYIYFDYNEPIITDEWVNTLDNILPESAVNELPEYTPSETVILNWNGNDIGAGIQSYDVYVSANGGPYELWLVNEPATEAEFFGIYDSTYSFYTVAQDSAGNFEVIPTVYDAMTTLIDCSQFSLSINESSDTAFCAGGNIELVAAGWPELEWSEGTVSDTLFVESTGLYFAQASPFGVCLITTDTIQVTVHDLPHIYISGEPVICEGESITLTAEGAHAYVWQDGTTAETIEVSSAATLFVIGTDENGCSNQSGTVEVTIGSTPEVFIVQSNDTLYAFPEGSSYQWYLNGELLFGETNQNLIPAESGNYSVGVNVNGCVGNGEMDVHIGIDDIVSAKTGMKLYPNPNNGAFTLNIYLPIAQTIDIQITDNTGKLIWMRSIYTQSGGERKTIQLNDISAGSYFLRVRGENTDMTERFTILDY